MEADAFRQDIYLENKESVIQGRSTSIQEIDLEWEQKLLNMKTKFEDMHNKLEVQIRALQNKID